MGRTLAGSASHASKLPSKGRFACAGLLVFYIMQNDIGMWSNYMYAYFVTAEKLRRLEAKCAKQGVRDYPKLQSDAL